MRRWVLCAALALGGCGEPTPLDPAEVAETVGTYRAAGCPDIQVTPDAMIAGSIRVKAQLIRIKLQPTIATDQAIRLYLDDKCEFSLARTAVFVFVHKREGRVSFDISDVGGSRAITYTRAGPLSGR